MPHQNTVFRQLSNLLPHGRFDRFVQAFDADAGVRKFTARHLLNTLLFAQLGEARGIRELESQLASHDVRRYHSGLPAVKRSTLSDALAKRDPEAFFALLSVLIGRLSGRQGRDLAEAAHAIRLIDSTSVRLSRTSADWARFSAHLCGAKAHVVYDPDANTPLYVSVTAANVNDITAAKQMPVEPGASYVFDLGYYDYGWWARLHEAGCRIVTRLKSNTPLKVSETRVVAVTEQAGGEDKAAILSDRIGTLPTRIAQSRHNPMSGPVREVIVMLQTGKTLRVMTNDLKAPAREIADLYKRRWAIELFFRWVKQMLKLRRFLGTSQNAVRLQIIVAMIAFVLIRLAHQASRCGFNLTIFAGLIRANILHRRPLIGLHGAPPGADAPPVQCANQQVFAWS